MFFLKKIYQIGSHYYRKRRKRIIKGMSKKGHFQGPTGPINIHKMGADVGSNKVKKARNGMSSGG